MLGTMVYKGLIGSVEYSKPDKCYYGKILGTTNVYLYEGGTLDELQKDFEAFAEDCLADCATSGIMPPYIGTLQKESYSAPFNSAPMRAIETA